MRLRVAGFVDPELLFGLGADQGGQSGGAFGLGSPVDANRRRRTDKGQHHRLIRRRLRFCPAFPGRRLRRGDQRIKVHLHARLRNPHPPTIHRSLRGLKGDAVLAGHLADRLGIFELEDDRLGLLALLLNQKLVIFAAADDPRRPPGKRGRGDRGVGQPQGDLEPALGEQVDLHARPSPGLRPWPPRPRCRSR